MKKRCLAILLKNRVCLWIASGFVRHLSKQQLREWKGKKKLKLVFS